MADWIKVEKTTARKPEVIGIAAELDIPIDQAFGLCVRFWCWCDDQLTDGNAPSVTPKLLDEIFGHKGFADALLKVHWLQSRSGSVVVPNFDRHLSESAKNRSLSSKRVAKSRSTERRQSNKCNDDAVTQSLPEGEREKECNTSVTHARGDPPKDSADKTIAEKPPDKTGDDLTFLRGFSKEFLRWWDVLPMGMRSGQKACWEIWPKVIVDIQSKLPVGEADAIQHLIDRTRLFASSPRGKCNEYRWSPLTFLKDGHYDDTVESWEQDGSSKKRRGGSKSVDKPENNLSRTIDAVREFLAE